MRRAVIAALLACTGALGIDGGVRAETSMIETLQTSPHADAMTEAEMSAVQGRSFFIVLGSAPFGSRIRFASVADVLLLDSDTLFQLRRGLVQRPSSIGTPLLILKDRQPRQSVFCRGTCPIPSTF